MITHVSLFQPEDSHWTPDHSHASEPSQTTVGASWCMMCRNWYQDVDPIALDQQLINELTPGILTRIDRNKPRFSNECRRRHTKRLCRSPHDPSTNVPKVWCDECCGWFIARHAVEEIIAS